MIVIRSLTILIAVASIASADFDDSILWKGYLPEPVDDGIGFGDHREGLESMFLHSNIYRINSLDWNYISVDYHGAPAGLGLEWSSMGFKEYFRRNKYRTRFQYFLHDKIKVAPLFEITTEEFKDLGNYTGLSGEISVEYRAEKYAAGTGLSEIQLKEPYDRSHNQGLFPYLFGSCIFDEGLAFSIGVRRFEEGRTRWIFHQSVNINENLGLNFGYQNNPSDIYGGLFFTFRRFSMIIIYTSVSGLSDSVVWGISYGP